MSTVSPVGPGGPGGSMSPQQQGLQRHGSPQPGMAPGMRPPGMMADPMRGGRFIRPSGPGGPMGGKDMRPRMQVVGPQGQRGSHPNYGPRGPMGPMVPGRHPSPVYSGPMGSPGHQSPQYQSGMQQMRPPSGGGQVTSPATDRPGNTPSPRTPGGSQPPSQPHTPDGQQFAQPSPQHIPQHHMQQVSYQKKIFLRTDLTKKTSYLFPSIIFISKFYLFQNFICFNFTFVS